MKISWISIKNSLKFFPKGPINIIQALVQIVAWRRPIDKPFSEQRWLDYWRLYASLDPNELSHPKEYGYMCLIHSQDLILTCTKKRSGKWEHILYAILSLVGDC